MQNVFFFSGLHLIQRGRRLSEPNVCAPSWYFRSYHILKVSEMIQIWFESLNRPPPRGLRCVWALFTCWTPQGAFFSKKTPISPLQHGCPVHAVCTQECCLPLEGQPPPEDGGAVIGAPGRRSELLFFVLSGWICRPTCGPRSPRRLAYITECQTHEAQRWKWQEKPVSPFFFVKFSPPPGRKRNLRLPPWKQRYRHVSGNKTLRLKHEVTFLLRRAEPATSEGVKQWNGIIWSGICFFTAASGWTGCPGEQGDRV